jgi:hypothetical protein
MYGFRVYQELVGYFSPRTLCSPPQAIIRLNLHREMEHSQK